jgi:hypothetical protein
MSEKHGPQVVWDFLVDDLVQAQTLLTQLSGFTPCRWLICPQELSRWGKKSWTELLPIVSYLQSQNQKIVLVWDQLLSEKEFGEKCRFFQRLIIPWIGHGIQSLRAKDAGVLWWLFENTHHVPLEFMADAGHMNLDALMTWRERLGDRLQLCAVSPELPLKKILEWQKNCGKNLALEILGLGPLLLFHSPRHLITAVEDEVSEGEMLLSRWREVEAHSEESPHKGFRFLENTQGTFMFHPKDLNILDEIREDIFMGPENEMRYALLPVHVRLELNHISLSQEQLQRVCDFLKTPLDALALERLSETWPHEVMRGYVKTNKSTVLFKKLRNQHLKKKDAFHEIEILDTNRESWLALRVRSGRFEKGLEYTLTNPQGESKMLTPQWIKNIHFEAVEKLEEGELGFIAWASQAPVKSILRRER